MSIKTRLAKLEVTKAAFQMPRLVIGRTDCDDERDAIGLHHCELRREPGEAWEAFMDRAWTWAADKPSFVAHVRYSEAAA